MSKNSPVQEGIILSCVKHGVDLSHLPKITSLVLASNPTVKKAEQLFQAGKLK